jgi:hypothetical protein
VGVATRIQDAMTEGIRRYAQRTLRTGLSNGMRRPKHVPANPNGRDGRPTRSGRRFPIAEEFLPLVGLRE